MDFVLGAGFTVLYDVVKEAMGGELLHFKPLEDLESTLDRLQPLIIQRIEKLNEELTLPTVQAEDLAKQMKKGAEIVPKFTKLQRWNCMVKCRYTGKLKKLDGCLKTLVDRLKMQDLVVIREGLVVGRQNANKLDKILEVQEQLKPMEKNDIMNLFEQNAKALARLEAALARLEAAPAIPTATRPSRKVDLKAPDEAETLQIGSPKSEEIVELHGSFLRPLDTDLEVQQEASEIMDAVVPISNTETELEPVEENSVVQEATLFAGHTLGAAFKELLDVLMYEKERTIVFKSLLKDIISTLDALEPLIERIEKYNKVLDCPKEELQHFENRLKNGAMLVQNLSKVQGWSSFKKYKYTKKLMELEKSLQELFEIFSVLEMRDSMETLRSISAKVGQIEYEVDAWDAVLHLPEVVVQLSQPLEELKKLLLKNEKLSMVMLVSPGGVGKTTLATMFCLDQEIKDFFKNNIYFVSVSKKPNLEHIVQQLYQCEGSQVPAIQNKEAALNCLQNFIEAKGEHPLLLVLDDVWPGSESLLQKLNEIKRPNYKILVTSRCHFQGLDCSCIIDCRVLDIESSMELFSLSLGDSSFPIDLAMKIVNECQGFPLAIKVVAGSLRGQPIQIWEQMLYEWSKHSPNDLLFYLGSSLEYGSNKETIKECFLDLCSFPEDQRIPAAALIDMWAELYDLNEDIECIANLQELTKRSLANPVVRRVKEIEVDGCYSQLSVTQHDLLREVALTKTCTDPIEHRKRLILEICGNDLPKWWTELKYWPKMARLVSISTDGEFSTQWNDMQLPEAEVLVLNFQTKNYVLPKFVEKMDKLKALIVTKYGFLHAKLGNFQLLGLLPNLKRIRLQRVSVPSITRHLVQLKSLRKVSLFMCNIGQAFSHCSIPISDAFSNLEEMNIDRCTELKELPADLCNLVQLKTLSITNCDMLHALPVEIGKLVNLEVLRLRSCTNLLELPGSIRNLKKLHFLDISDCVGIKSLPEGIGEMISLRKLTMRRCSGLQGLPRSLLDLEQLLLTGSDMP